MTPKRASVSHCRSASSLLVESSVLEIPVGVVPRRPPRRGRRRAHGRPLRYHRLLRPYRRFLKPAPSFVHSLRHRCGIGPIRATLIRRGDPMVNPCDPALHSIFLTRKDQRATFQRDPTRVMGLLPFTWWLERLRLEGVAMRGTLRAYSEPRALIGVDGPIRLISSISPSDGSVSMWGWSRCIPGVRSTRQRQCSSSVSPSR